MLDINKKFFELKTSQLWMKNHLASTIMWMAWKSPKSDLQELLGVAVKAEPLLVLHEWQMSHFIRKCP